jgi:hypothetical protein
MNLPRLHPGQNFSERNYIRPLGLDCHAVSLGLLGSDFWAASSNGKTLGLHPRVRGSIPRLSTNKEGRCSYLRKFLVSPARVQLATPGLEGRCSMQLSYRDPSSIIAFRVAYMKPWRFNREAYERLKRERFCSKCGQEFGKVSSRKSHEKICHCEEKAQR